MRSMSNAVINSDTQLQESHLFSIDGSFPTPMSLRRFILSHTSSLGRRLLSNRDLSGNPKQVLSPIRYAVERDRACVHVLLWGTNLQVALILEALTDSSLGFQHTAMVMDLRTSQDVRCYHSTMAIKNRFNRYHVSFPQQCENIIQRCILRQAELLDLPLPNRGLLSCLGVHIMSMSSVEQRSQNRVILKKFRAHYVLDIKFSMAFKLDGHWAVGSLVNHGYGCCNECTKP